MQTADGRLPQSMTASEFAAFLDLHVLPVLRQAHMDDPAHGSFDADCLAFARELGLDEEHRHLVQLPAWVSLDNATIHPWGRKLLCRPRAPAADIDAHVRERYAEKFGSFHGLQSFTLEQCAEPRAPRPPATSKRPGASGFVPDHVHGADRAAVRKTLQGDAQERFRQAMAEYEAEHRVWIAQKHACERVFRQLEQHDQQPQQAEQLSWMQQTLRDFANQRKDARVLLPQQFMPLVRVTPDIHMAVEHMVRTLKFAVKQQALLHMHSDMLFYARTWQGWLEEAVEERGNGERGRKHIKRSVEKQEWVCRILRASEDDIVIVRYVFGDGGANDKGRKTEVWRVRGTAGGWILDSKWT